MARSNAVSQELCRACNINGNALASIEWGNFFNGYLRLQLTNPPVSGFGVEIAAIELPRDEKCG